MIGDRTGLGFCKRMLGGFAALLPLLSPALAQERCSNGLNEAKVVQIGDDTIARWPGFAALRLVKGSVEQYICGGTVISREWVLTAAHCVSSLAKSSASGNYENKNGWRLELLLGTADLEFVSKDNQFEPADITPHSGYQQMRNAEKKLIGILHDIALIRLNRPWEGPIGSLGTLPSDSTLLRTAGFGVSGTGEMLKLHIRKSDNVSYYSGSVALKVATMPQSSLPRCRKAYENSPYINASHICAGTIWKGEDACQGDSGGPLVALEFATGCPFVVGLVSWGGRCGFPEEYGVYTRAEAYGDWIRTNTNNVVTVAKTTSEPLSSLQQKLLQQLEEVLKPVAANMRVYIRDQGKLKIGTYFRVTIDTPVAGRLILIDVKPDGQITQILPNTFSPGEVEIPSTNPVKFPNRETHGFDGFEAEDIPGRGRIIAIIVPRDFPYSQFLRGVQSLSDSDPNTATFNFDDRTGTAYLTSLVDQIIRAGVRQNESGGKQWAFGIANYEQVP